MLDPRAVACLGIGTAAPVMARLGLWDIPIDAPAGDFYPSGRAQPGKKSRLRHQAKAGARLVLGVGIRSEARLVLATSVAVNLPPAAEITAGLCLGANAGIQAAPALEAAADCRDILLEMLLLSD